MSTDYENKAIKCTLTNCENHSSCAEYCGIKEIQVGTHEANPTKIPCSDCKSFRCDTCN